MPDYFDAIDAATFDRIMRAVRALENGETPGRQPPPNWMPYIAAGGTPLVPYMVADDATPNWLYPGAAFSSPYYGTVKAYPLTMQSGAFLPDKSSEAVNLYDYTGQMWALAWEQVWAQQINGVLQIVRPGAALYDGVLGSTMLTRGATVQASVTSMDTTGATHRVGLYVKDRLLAINQTLAAGSAILVQPDPHLQCFAVTGASCS